MEVPAPPPYEAVVSGDSFCRWALVSLQTFFFGGANSSWIRLAESVFVMALRIGGWVRTTLSL